MEPLPRSDAPSSWRARGWSLLERLGVRPLLFLALGTSAVGPVALLGFDQAERWAASELASTDRQALGAARAAAGQLSIAMLGYLHAAQAFSAQLEGAASLDPPALRAAMHAHLASHPEFIGAYIADAKGMSLLNATGLEFLEGHTDYSDRDYEWGQLLLLATDGLMEQTNGQRQRFDARLVELDLGAVADAGAALGRLMLEFESFVAGQAVRDDVTVIVLGCSAQALEGRSRPPLSRS